MTAGIFDTFNGLAARRRRGYPSISGSATCGLYGSIEVQVSQRRCPARAWSEASHAAYVARRAVDAKPCGNLGVVTNARSWTLMAFSQPALFAIGISLVSDPIRLVTWCHMGLERLTSRAFSILLLAVCVLAAAVALTFATEALRNVRLHVVVKCAWALGLLLASPIVAPLYWFIFLRVNKG
jgi:hypothetical protein